MTPNKKAPKAQKAVKPAAGRKGLLRARARLRPKKYFIREAHVKKVDDYSWRIARGVRNKNRKQFAGHGPRVRVGFGAPNAVKGMTYDGFIPLRIFNTSFEKLAPDQALLIAGGVGAKKRGEIIAKADKLGIRVLNR